MSFKDTDRKMFSIDPNAIKVRDPLMLLLIGGATKAATHTDRKKQDNKMKCRRKCNSHTED